MGPLEYYEEEFEKTKTFYKEVKRLALELLGNCPPMQTGYPFIDKPTREFLEILQYLHFDENDNIIIGKNIEITNK